MLSLACLFAGPSKIFGLPESLLLIAIGLFLMGSTIAPIFVQTLPYVFLNTQLKYKIVEGANEKLDGYISD